MYDISKKQPSFAGGEISPKLYAATHLTRYETGMARVLNWVVEPEGTTRTRPPTKRIRKIAENSVLHTGRFKNDSVVMEFTVGAGYAHTDSQLYSLPDLPYELADLPALNFSQLNDLFFITDGKHLIGLLKHYAHDDWQFEYAISYDGPYEAENIDDAKTMSIYNEGFTSEEADAAILVRDAVGYKPYRKLWRDNMHIMKITCVGDIIKAAHVGSLFEIIDYDYSDVPPWVANEEITAPPRWRRVDERVYLCDGDGNSGTVIPEWTEAYEYAPEKDALKWRYTHSNRMQGHILTVDEDANTALVVTYGAQVISLMGVASYSWRLGSWSGVNGYPKFSEFHQQRFVPAATEAAPRAIWPSKIDDYFNHDVNGNPAGAIALSNPASYGDEMLWMESSVDLVFGTNVGETFVRHNKNNAGFTFDNISVDKAGKIGSAPMEPIIMPNSEMILAHKSLKQLFAASVNEGIKNLGIMSAHLLKAGIKKIILQTDPYTVIYCLMHDGRIAVLTYEFDQEVIAWADWDLGGIVDDICIIPHGSGEQVYFKVQRGNDWFLELLDWHFEPKKDTSSDLVPMLDGQIELTSVAATKVFSGLDDYNGLVVDVYVDGHGYTDLPVTGGAITLPHEATRIIVGFAYENLLRLLPAQFGLQDGGSDGRLRQCKLVTLNMDACFGGLVGEAANVEQDKKDGLWEAVLPGAVAANLPYKNKVLTVLIEAQQDALDFIDIYQNKLLPMRIKAITRTVEIFKAQADGGSDV